MSSKIEQTAREIVEIMGNEDMLVLMDTRTLEQLLKQLKENVQAADKNPKISEKFRQAAKRQYEEDGQIEIDDDAIVSMSDDGGAYVQAWVYVSEGE